jgi:hypothetical protein
LGENKYFVRFTSVKTIQSPDEHDALSACALPNGSRPESMRHLGLPAISNRLLTLFMANAQQRQGFNMLEEIGHLTKCI